MNKIIELIIDENDETSGIDAVSVVSSPAIEENFIALAKHEIILKEVDAEKRILMGAALVPNKQIYRRNEKDEEYYIYFSEKTVRKASELFLMRSNQNNATYEHKDKLEGLSVVESWIIEDMKQDKSKKYGFDLPVGTWMISMKVNNDEVWKDVKEGKVKGFSIEGYFADKYEMSLKNEEDILLEQIKNIILAEEKTNLETYNDYPEAAKENAKIALRYAEENGWGDCGTPVGKARANQLANGENISEETIARMASFERQRENSNKELGDGCGRLMWLAWGGDAGVEWASRKLKQIRNEELAEGQTHYTIDGKIWRGETHKDAQGRLMTGKVHTADSKPLYHAVSMAEIGERGGIRESDKAPKSDTKNPNPKGEGTAKGDASTSRGAEVPKEIEESLQKKADEFNEKYKEKLGYGVTVGQLKTVYQRGVGAFNTSHSPEVKSQQQWAQARVNAYLYLVKNGRPQNPKYVTDYDLLPSKHPKANK